MQPNKWWENFDERPHLREDFSLRKFNVMLICFCGRPLGILMTGCGEIPMSRSVGTVLGGL